jgi:hypothetical protein
MKILVIGAGWYGCHLSLVLQAEGYSITVVDKAGAPFSGSSLKNQNRLHQGFHYPRSSQTIIECQKGYPLFLEQYGFMTEDISANLYCIAEQGSHITADEFERAMLLSGNSFDTLSVTETPLPIQGVGDRIFRVKEKYINPTKAAAYFHEKLQITQLPSVEDFNSIDSILDALGETFDLVINCTYNHLEPIPYDTYEVFITFLYHIPCETLFAYTLMDGPFFSIYPYDISRQIYTVTHVKHCVFAKGHGAISETMQPMPEQIEEIQQRVEKSVCDYIPSFATIATRAGHYISWKTKPTTDIDDRSIRYAQAGNRLSIYGGKITGIFEAEEVTRSTIVKISL